MTGHVDVPPAEGELRETVRRHSFLFLLQGVLMVAAGLVAFVYPLTTTLAATIAKSQEDRRVFELLFERFFFRAAEAEALRDRFELPGMEVLQFAFAGDASNRFLPHHYRPNCVVYTGTHDNDTTVGWFRSASPQERCSGVRPKPPGRCLPRRLQRSPRSATST